jgi:hypothetical protein
MTDVAVIVLHEVAQRLPAQEMQGAAGNKNGEFMVEDQFLSKLHTNNGYIFLTLLLKGTQKRGSRSERCGFLARDPLQGGEGVTYKSFSSSHCRHSKGRQWVPTVGSRQWG